MPSVETVCGKCMPSFYEIHAKMTSSEQLSTFNTEPHDFEWHNPCLCSRGPDMNYITVQGSHGIEKPGKSREFVLVFFPGL